MSGWIKLHRKLQQNPMWLAEPFTRGQAWADLLMLANYESGHLRVRGVRVDIPRGSVGWAKESLATRWKWSRGKVNRFLSELEVDGQVVQQTGQPLNAIKLCNYNEYNPLEAPSSTTSSTTNGTTNGTPNGTSDGHQTVHQTVQEEEVNNKKEGKEVKKKTRRSPLALPNWMPVDKWDAYVRARRSMKKHPMTNEALQISIAAIEKTKAAGYSIDEILDAMIEGGWRSIKPDWMENRKGGQQQSHQKQETHDERAERLDREMFPENKPEQIQ